MRPCITLAKFTFDIVNLWMWLILGAGSTALLSFIAISKSIYDCACVRSQADGI